jgi:hypothetical protein
MYSFPPTLRNLPTEGISYQGPLGHVNTSDDQGLGNTPGCERARLGTEAF